MEIISDWTFSTAYKGSLRFISNHSDRIKNLTGLRLICSEPQGEIRVEQTEEQIPYNKLGPENPILHHGSLYLFESDLEDCGYAMAQTRFRVMEDCYFILVRYYLRVDGVRVRMFDTRIYHEFGTNHLIREFKHLESDFEMLRG